MASDEDSYSESDGEPDPFKTPQIAVAMARAADIAEVRAKAAQIEVRGFV